jgi:hypothetical protein
MFRARRVDGEWWGALFTGCPYVLTWSRDFMRELFDELDEFYEFYERKRAWEQEQLRHQEE